MMHISNRTRTGGGCIRFNYMKKAVRKGGRGGGGFPTLNFKYFNSADIFGISVLSLWYGGYFSSTFNKSIQNSNVLQ